MKKSAHHTKFMWIFKEDEMSISGEEMELSLPPLILISNHTQELSSKHANEAREENECQQHNRKSLVGRKS